jgi:hypothetical protein
MKRVSLEWYEYAMASDVGRMRSLASIRQGLKHKYGMSTAGWTESIEGACGELAVAKALGIYWDGSVNTFKAPDVGNLQVRTRSKDHYDLIVRPEDKSEDVFVLVTGVCPDYVVHGWTTGADAKQGCYLQTYGNRPPAYFVPKDRLSPIEELE